jgi:hypothetical protein
MVTVNQRGWTFLDEDSAPDPDSPRGKAIEARASALMQEWSTLHHEAEQEGWSRQSAMEDGDPGYDPRICECTEGADKDPDELCVHDRKALTEMDATEKLRLEGRALRMQLIEAELQGFGARKMRPYEHWNEDERYMAYMEEGRFGHYSD